MALNLAGSTVEGLDDMETQRISADVTWDTNELTGGFDTPLPGISQKLCDIAQGLERDEVAELVHVEASVTALVAATTETVDTTGQVEVSLTSDADVPFGAFQSETNADGVVANYDCALDPEHIIVTDLSASGGFEDSASGVGGAGSPANVSQTLNYRDAFEMGPTYDRHDDLYLHASARNFDIQDGSLFVSVNYTLYWAIHDREDF